MRSLALLKCSAKLTCVARTAARPAVAAALVAPPLGRQAAVTAATGFPENALAIGAPGDGRKPALPCYPVAGPPKEDVAIPFGAKGPHAKSAGRDCEGLPRVNVRHIKAGRDV